MERRSWGSDCPLVHYLPGAHGHLLHGATSLEPKCFTHVAIGVCLQVALIIAYLAWVLALALFIGLALPVALSPKKSLANPTVGSLPPISRKPKQTSCSQCVHTGQRSDRLQRHMCQKRGVSGCHERQKPAVSAAGEMRDAETIEKKASRKLPEELRTR